MVMNSTKLSSSSSIGRMACWDSLFAGSAWLLLAAFGGDAEAEPELLSPRGVAGFGEFVVMAGGRTRPGSLSASSAVFDLRRSVLKSVTPTGMPLYRISQLRDVCLKRFASRSVTPSWATSAVSLLRHIRSGMHTIFTGSITSGRDCLHVEATGGSGTRLPSTDPVWRSLQVRV